MLRTWIKRLANGAISTYKQIASYKQQPLPITEADFQAWVADIVDLAGFPNNDSMQFAIATMVLHADAKTYKASKRHFVIQLRRAASNQVAGNLMQDLKDKQKAAREQAKQEVASALGT